MHRGLRILAGVGAVSFVMIAINLAVVGVGLLLTPAGPPRRPEAPRGPGPTPSSISAATHRIGR